jgi:outer membrane receptor for ferrienterochelin and colicins
MKKITLLACAITFTMSTWAQQKDTPKKTEVTAEDFDLEDLVGADTSKALQKNYAASQSRQSISTATKVATRMDNIPTITEVISAQQIEQRGYRHLSDVLNDIPDNHQDRSNWGIGEPLNQNVGFGLRFDTGQNILILYNGQRLNGFLYGARFGGEEYLLTNIERIEIIRGGGSSLYGANAFTCVVNLISRQSLADGKTSSFDAGVVGNFNAGGIMGHASGIGKVGKEGVLSGALRYGTEEGQSLLVQNNLYGDAKLKDGLRHAIDAELFYKNKSFRIYSKMTDQNRNTFTGFNGVTPADLPQGRLSTFAYSLGTDYTLKASAKSEFKFQGGWHRDNWREVALVPIFRVNANGDSLVRDPQGSPILDNVSIVRNGDNKITPFLIDGQGATTESIDGEVQFTYKYNGFNNIVSGVYLNYDRIVSAERPSEIQLAPLAFAPFKTYSDFSNNWLFDLNASRLNTGVYAQIDYELSKRFLFNAGARLDMFSGTGALNQSYSSFNPRGGLIYINRETGNFKLMYGEAFRAPNGVEALSSVTILGSPLNRPEQISMLQFQWAKNWGKSWRTELGGFRAEVQNALRTDANISESLQAQAFVGQFINVPGNEKTISNGVDGKVTYAAEKLEFEMNFTKIFGTNNGMGKAIAYVPQTMVNLKVNIPVGWLNINLSANHRADFTKAENDPRAAVGNYTLVNAKLIAKLKNTPIEFSLMGRNLLNADIRYPSSSTSFVNNFPARGVEIIAGVLYRIK